jgi:hypothetical protein
MSNKRGPRAEPCGTPENTEKGEYLIFLKYEQINIYLVSSFRTT